MSSTITRKDIAHAADVCTMTVKRKEQEWGLLACKSNALKGRVRFFREKANKTLIALGIISIPI